VVVMVTADLRRVVDVVGGEGEGEEEEEEEEEGGGGRVPSEMEGGEGAPLLVEGEEEEEGEEEGSW